MNYALARQVLMNAADPALARRARSSFNFPSLPDLGGPPEFPKEEEKGLFRRSVDAAKGVFIPVLDVLNATGYATTGAIKNIVDTMQGDDSFHPLLSFWEGLTLKKKLVWGDILAEDFGFAPKSKLGRVGGAVVSLALDIATDPLTYVGVGMLTKAGRLGKAGKGAMGAAGAYLTLEQQAKMGHRAFLSLAIPFSGYSIPVVKGQGIIAATGKAGRWFVNQRKVGAVIKALRTDLAVDNPFLRQRIRQTQTGKRLLVRETFLGIQPFTTLLDDAGVRKYANLVTHGKANTTEDVARFLTDWTEFKYGRPLEKGLVRVYHHEGKMAPRTFQVAPPTGAIADGEWSHLDLPEGSFKQYSEKSPGFVELPDTPQHLRAFNERLPYFAPPDPETLEKLSGPMRMMREVLEEERAMLAQTQAELQATAIARLTKAREMFGTTEEALGEIDLPKAEELIKLALHPGGREVPKWLRVAMKGGPEGFLGMRPEEAKAVFGKFGRGELGAAIEMDMAAKRKELRRAQKHHRHLEYEATKARRVNDRQMGLIGKLFKHFRRVETAAARKGARELETFRSTYVGQRFAETLAKASGERGQVKGITAIRLQLAEIRKTVQDALEGEFGGNIDDIQRLIKRDPTAGAEFKLLAQLPPILDEVESGARTVTEGLQEVGRIFRETDQLPIVANLAPRLRKIPALAANDVDRMNRITMRLADIQRASIGQQWGKYAKTYARLQEAKEAILAKHNAKIEKYFHEQLKPILNDLEYLSIRGANNLGYMTHATTQEARQLLQDKLPRVFSGAGREFSDKHSSQLERSLHAYRGNRLVSNPTIREVNESLADPSKGIQIIVDKETRIKVTNSDLAKFFHEDPFFILAIRGMKRARVVPGEEFINWARHLGTITQDAEHSAHSARFGLWFKPQEHELIEKTREAFFTDKAMNALMSWFDNFNNWWKPITLGPFPKYHIRNYLSGGFNNMLVDSRVVLQPQWQHRAWRMALAHVRGKEKNLPADMQKILQESLRGPVFDAGLVATEWAHGLRNQMERFNIRQVIRGEVSNLPIYHPQRALSRLQGGGSFLESIPRIMLFDFARTKLGHTVEAAAELVHKVHFDYQDLTSFERFGQARSIFPFMTWTRFNLPLQVEQFIHRPGKYTPLLDLKAEAEGWADLGGEEKPLQTQLLPEFYRETLPVKLPWKTATGAQTVMDVIAMTPVQELQRLFPAELASGRDFPLNIVLGAVRAPTEMLVDLLSPAARTPIEMAKGVSLFSGQPIKQTPGAIGRHALQSVLRAYGEWSRFARKKEELPEMGWTPHMFDIMAASTRPLNVAEERARRMRGIRATLTRIKNDMIEARAKGKSTKELERRFREVQAEGRKVYGR